MNSGMIRIRAKAVQPTTSGGAYPRLTGILPCWHDIECYVVAEDGSETPLTGVRSVRFEGREGAEPLTATLEVYLDEVDVLAEVRP